MKEFNMDKIKVLSNMYKVQLSVICFEGEWQVKSFSFKDSRCNIVTAHRKNIEECLDIIVVELEILRKGVSYETI